MTYRQFPDHVVLQQNILVLNLLGWCHGSSLTAAKNEKGQARDKYHTHNYRARVEGYHLKRPLLAKYLVLKNILVRWERPGGQRSLPLQMNDGLSVLAWFHSICTSIYSIPSHLIRESINSPRRSILTFSERHRSRVLAPAPSLTCYSGSISLTKKLESRSEARSAWISPFYNSFSWASITHYIQCRGEHTVLSCVALQNSN